MTAAGPQQLGAQAIPEILPFSFPLLEMKRGFFLPPIQFCIRPLSGLNWPGGVARTEFQVGFKSVSIHSAMFRRGCGKAHFTSPVADMTQRVSVVPTSGCGAESAYPPQPLVGTTDTRLQ